MRRRFRSGRCRGARAGRGEVRRAFTLDVEFAERHAAKATAKATKASPPSSAARLLGAYANAMVFGRRW